MTEKHLRVEYDGKVLYDSAVTGTFTWSEGPNGVNITVSEPKSSSLLDALRGAADQKQRPARPSRLTAVAKPSFSSEPEPEQAAGLAVSMSSPDVE